MQYKEVDKNQTTMDMAKTPSYNYEEVFKPIDGDQDINFEKIAKLIESKNYIGATKRFSKDNTTLITKSEINLTDIPEKFWFLCSEACKEAQSNEMFMRKMLVFLGNLFPRLVTNDTDNYLVIDNSLLVQNLCNIRPLDEKPFKVAIYVISTILDINICFEQFNVNFPWENLDIFISNDETSQEISNLFLVLAKYIENNEIVCWFKKVFVEYMKKTDNLSPQMVFLVTKYCASETFLTEDIWGILFDLLHKTEGVSRIALFETYSVLAQSFPDKFNCVLNDIFAVMCKTTKKQDQLFAKGCDFMQYIIKNLGIAFPNELKFSLILKIMNRLDNFKMKYFNSYLGCLSTIILYSRPEEVVSYIEINNIPSKVIDFVSSDDVRLIVISLRILIDMRNILKFAKREKMMDDFIDEDLVSLVFDLRSNENEAIANTANDFIIEYELEEED